MLKFFLNQKKYLFNKHIFFSFSRIFQETIFFFAFLCFFLCFWFKKFFFFKCFFFKFKIFFFTQKQSYNHKIRRQGTLGSQRKIWCRICHKNQHLFIYDDFGIKKKKSNKMLFFHKFVVKKCKNCFKCSQICEFMRKKQSKRPKDAKLFKLFEFKKKF